jgi:ankyrin repeat protein
VNQAKHNGATPLHIAAQIGHLDGVRALVTELGADVNQAKQDGATPLLIAAQNGHLEVVRALVTEMGADVNQAEQNGSTPLCVAAEQGHLEVVRALVAELGADVNQATQDGVTPLMVAAAMQHEHLAKWLARHGANISLSSEDYGKASNLARSNDLAQWLESKSSCANPECVEGSEKRCARCRKVRYCSRECQVAHYRIHKATCRPPTEDDDQ